MGVALAVFILMMVFMSDIIAFMAMVGLLLLGVFEFILNLFGKSSSSPDRVSESKLKKAYQKYVDSHTTYPKNPKGPLLSDQLISVKSMKYSYDGFKEKCSKSRKFYNKYKWKI